MKIFTNFFFLMVLYTACVFWSVVEEATIPQQQKVFKNGKVQGVLYSYKYKWPRMQGMSLTLGKLPAWSWCIPCQVLHMYGTTLGFKNPNKTALSIGGRTENLKLSENPVPLGRNINRPNMERQTVQK